MNLDELNQLDLKSVGQWSAGPRYALLAFLLALILGLGWWFLWRPTLAEIDQARAQEQTLKDSFLAKKRQAINLDAHKQQLKDIEQAFGALLKQLPNRSEMDALLTDINQAGLGRGLRFELFKPGAETTTEFYAEMPITIKVSGSYHDLGAFTSDVAQLSRIVTIHDANINSDAKGGLIMDAVVKTYRYLDVEEQTAQAQKNKAAAPGAKGKK
jgi:type IV pilus assembly protein PilO